MRELKLLLELRKARLLTQVVDGWHYPLNIPIHWIIY